MTQRESAQCTRPDFEPSDPSALNSDSPDPTDPPASGVINFVFPGLEAWKDLTSADAPDLDAVPERIVYGPESWVLQTYLRLRRRGRHVRLVEGLLPGQVCVVYAGHLARFRSIHSSYLVVVRADQAPVRTCEHCIVQNGNAITAGCEYFIPHWPQPGLQPRDEGRGARVLRVAFFGQIHNLSKAFQSDDFRRSLQELGVELVFKEDAWHDYSDIDAVLAVRDLPTAALSAKPATKLVNAWLAGCPAILGAESAYQFLRRSDLDYMEVSTPEDAVAAIARLSQDPDLYRAMVENGRQRSTEWDVSGVSQHWERFFDQVLSSGFPRWSRFPRCNGCWRRCRYIGRWIRQWLARTVYLARAGYVPGETRLSLGYKLCAAFRIWRREGTRALLRRFRDSSEQSGP